MCVECYTVSREGSVSLIVEFDNLIFKYGHIMTVRFCLTWKKFCVYFLLAISDHLFPDVQATFFITYVLTSGWASLSSEVIQLFALIWNFIRRYVFRRKGDPSFVPSFPYHTEVPRVLLFGLLGFTCAILAPLILPFLLVYFLLGYVVYRNQVST